jgi:PleD family two-component response regulator
MGGADRRRAARGGRRPGDVQGFAPLILVADDDLDNSARCEAILAGLRFAVAPARTSEEALRVMHALKPNLVVMHLKDGTGLQERMAADQATADVPIINITPEISEPTALIQEIRRVLRERRSARV